MSENPYEDIYSGKDNSLDETQEIKTDSESHTENEYFEHTQHNDEENFEDNYAEIGQERETVDCNNSQQANTQYEEKNCVEDTDSDGEKQGSCEWYGDEVIENRTPTQYGMENAPKKERKKRTGVKRSTIAVVLILCIVFSALFGGAGAYFVYNYLDNHTKKGTGGLTIERVEQDNYGATDSATTLSTVQIVENTADSVVEIITESIQTGSFTQQYIKSGGGSGVIVDSSGYIVTNNHVVENARKITVTLRSGKSYEATLVGTDSRTDVALIKIEETGLKTAKFGNSDTLKVGEKTVAIGNPLGRLGGTVTEGILSALDRDVVVEGQTMSLIQTDTAINPGNSGGGLFNSQGLLVGIVNAKSSGSEVEGLGFAIPINDVIDVLSDLMEYGYVRGRVDIGMEFIDIESEVDAWMYNLSELGCYVYSVDRGSSAHQNGIKSGDLVLEVNGQEVSSSADIEKIIEDMNVGDKLTFKVMRSNKVGEITITLEEQMPDSAFNNDDDLSNWYDYGY